MNTITISRDTKKKIGKLPVVILPLDEYEQIKDDLAMLQSKQLAKDIERARKEVKKGKIITLAELERKFNF